VYLYLNVSLTGKIIVVHQFVHPFTEFLRQSNDYFVIVKITRNILHFETWIDAMYDVYVYDICSIFYYSLSW
jgi:hypothetical protein